MMKNLFLVMLAGAAPILTNAFLEQFSSSSSKHIQMDARPDLQTLVDQQKDVVLKLQLLVGNDNAGFLAAKDMIIELHGRRATYEHVSLPGADGFYSQCSSGHRSVDVLSKGTFINLSGIQHIDCQKGCWEVCWLKDKPAGTLVCAFHIDKDYKRNDAVLPEGEMWMSFPLWTANGLQYGQSEKSKIMSEIQANVDKRDEELVKFDMTQNPIMRAIHIKKALAFAERCSELHHRTLDTIPALGEVLKLQDNLLLANRGLIWRKNGEGDVLLGQAFVASAVVASDSTERSTTHLGKLMS
jgi:hypothetical protein